jgi:hypothetical protein
MAAITIDLLESLLNRGDYVHMAPDGSITVAEHGSMKAQYEEMRNELDIARSELHALKSIINTPETEDFDKGVPLEATHQIQRWGAAHDAGKQPEDWFWLCGYLAGKALSSFKAGDVEKAKHHCISTAAAMRNWHKAIATGESAMRPGISAEKASKC